MEGFGLPALEALAVDCEVLASDIPVFREILAESPAILVGKTSDHWVAALEACWKHRDKKVWETQKQKQQFFKRFSWDRLAHDTLTIYEDSVGLRSGK